MMKNCPESLWPARSMADKQQDNRQPMSALEKKMMECTNLFEQSRGTSFSKQRLRSAPANKPSYPANFNTPRSTQQASQGARLPGWCQSQHVPPLYREMERQLSSPSTPGRLDGALVCSLLMSSGLSRPVLGRIWELCSRTLPGSFTPQEFYMALALVAVAQAGHAPELELLSRLPQAPIPRFGQQLNNVHGSQPMPPPSPPWTNQQAYHVPQASFQPAPTGITRFPTVGSQCLPPTTGASSTILNAPPTELFAVGCGGKLGMNSDMRSSVRAFGEPNASSVSARLVLAPPVQATTCSFPAAAGSGDFEDDFDDFKSAEAPNDRRGSVASDSSIAEQTTQSSEQLHVTPPQPATNSLESCPSPSNPVQQPRHPRACAPLPAASRSSFSQTVWSQQNLRQSPKNTKPFQFSLKIDLNSLVSTNTTGSSQPPKPSESSPKPPEADRQQTESKPVESSRVLVVAAPVPEDDFADFQQAFPGTLSQTPVPSEDRYSALKELSEDAMIQWDDTSAFTLPDRAASDEGATWAVDSANIDTWQSSLVPTGATHQEEDEDFGDFCHVTVVAPPVEKQLGGLFGGSVTPNTSGGFSTQPSNDSVSLGDGLSVSSLDFGAREGCLSSRHGSVLSLDFRLGNSDDDESAKTGGSEEGCTAAGVEEASETAASSDTTSDTQPEGIVFTAEQPACLLDKYSVIREGSQDVPVGEAASIDNWLHCLESIRELVLQAESAFNRECSSQVCREALDTEEGSNYIRNVAEVYKVCQRIALSSRLTRMQSDRLEQLCSEVQDTWERLSSFLENSCLFTLQVPAVEDPKWLPEAEDSTKACGVCLLHVDNPEIAPSKLTYSGRQYHAPCANLWVNCVNSLLPAIPLVQLL